MRLQPTVAWRPDAAGAEMLDPRTVALLRGIAEHGTLSAAAAGVGVSYRWAWGLLAELERIVGAPLVALARGRGARLTPLGEHWLALDAKARSVLAARGRELELPVRAAPRKRARRLTLAASHDLALSELRERWKSEQGIDVEFHGSAASLARYVEGAADVAGFHVAQRQRGRDVLLSLLRPGRDAVIRFLRRTQGLIVARGNPKRVRTLRDVAARRLRFVNRQPGSGTRILLDRMLAAEGIDAAVVTGYANEEFTHAAVAATVAAGKADVGLGLEAAAAAFGLGFVPLAEERYLFACRRRAADSDVIAAFRVLLASDETAAVVGQLAGYALDAPGTLADLERANDGSIVLR